ncbi:MAG: hydantoinase/oxoprolinase family protein [Chloroflexi bacterium]|nr:hydantoinase/oxoprolinase family protein [Chloroflexota bacterium]
MRLGIDVGGTFVDFVIAKDAGEFKVHKCLSSKRDPAAAVIGGITSIAEQLGLTVSDFLGNTSEIIHGSTIAINAILTREGAAAGLITNDGLRDALEMRRARNEEPFNLKYQSPRPPVPRYLRLPARGRLDYRGDEMEEVDLADVDSALETFQRHGVQSVAICLMHSYLNSAHEALVAERVRTQHPDWFVTASSEIAPTVRFYDRVSTVCLNAYVGPLVDAYLNDLLSRLAENGFDGSFLVMTSSGGMVSPATASRLGVLTIQSGPAAAPVAAAAHVAPIGYKDCIVVDMGGTSFDVCLLQNGSPLVRSSSEVNRQAVNVPMIAVRSIGAGGGSIARIEGGLLRVGPASAGAEPGPACYDFGGTQPTVTDANLVLGYLSPDSFFGGRIRLNEAAAGEAIRVHVAEPLGINVQEAAAAIYNVTNANMVNAIEEITIEHGVDIRQLPMVVAGGAGPLHATAIARELDISLIIVPRLSATFCAAGMLFSDVRREYARGYFSLLPDIKEPDLRAIVADLIAGCETDVEAGHSLVKQRSLSFSMDLRYMRQFNELTVPLPLELLEAADIEAIRSRFDDAHMATYGYNLPDHPVEVLNVRLTLTGHVAKPPLPRVPYSAARSRLSAEGYRSICLPNGVTKEVPVYDALKIQAGDIVPGPALVERPDTTILVPEDFCMGCDVFGSFVIASRELAPGISNRINSLVGQGVFS